MADGLLEPPLSRQDISQVIMGISIVGFDAQRLKIVANGLLEFFLLSQGDSKVIVRFSKVGFNPQGL